MPIRPPGAAFVLCAVVLLSPQSAPAQSTPPGLLTVERYLDWETVNDPQISPDGSQVIYTRRWVNKQKDRWESALWIMARTGPEPVPGARLERRAGRPMGRALLYLAEGERRAPQISRALDGRRGRELAGDARRARAGQPALVAGRPHARLHHARAAGREGP
jgi:hypothetical protein